MSFLKEILVKDIKELFKELEELSIKESEDLENNNTKERLDVVPYLDQIYPIKDVSESLEPIQLLDTKNILNKLVMNQMLCVDKMTVLKVLSNYDAEKLFSYGILILHKDKVFNPMHVYKVEEFLLYLENVSSDDKTFDIFTYHLASKRLLRYTKNYNKVLMEAYQSSIVKELYTFRQFKKSVSVSVKYNRQDTGSYAKMINATDTLDVETPLKSRLLDAIETNLINSFIDQEVDIFFRKDIRTRLNKGSFIIQPVHLSTTSRKSFPYYGLLALSGKNDDSSALAGSYLSPNFKSGNISLPHFTDYHLLAIENESDYNVIKNGELFDNNPDGEIEIVTTQFLDFIEEGEEEDYLEKYVLKDFDIEEDSEFRDRFIEYLGDSGCRVGDSWKFLFTTNKNGHYDNIIQTVNAIRNKESTDRIFTGTVCVGDLPKELTSLNALQNQNLDSAFRPNGMGARFFEEAIAHQNISRLLISSHLDRLLEDPNYKLSDSYKSDQESTDKDDDERYTATDFDFSAPNMSN